MTKKTRSALKDYFRANAMPTEGQFAELIDSMCNLRDDGLVKDAGQSLGLVADSSESQTVLRLYGDDAGGQAKPAWSLALNAKRPSGSEKSDGLAILDGEGNTKLILDRFGNLTVPGELVFAGGRKAAAVADPIKIYTGRANLATSHEGGLREGYFIWDIPVTFEKPFSTMPTVIVGLELVDIPLDQPGVRSVRAGAFARDLAPAGFTLCISCNPEINGKSTLNDCQAFWLAFGT